MWLLCYNQTVIHILKVQNTAIELGLNSSILVTDPACAYLTPMKNLALFQPISLYQQTFLSNNACKHFKAFGGISKFS